MSSENKKIDFYINGINEHIDIIKDSFEKIKYNLSSLEFILGLENDILINDKVLQQINKKEKRGRPKKGVTIKDNTEENLNLEV